MSLTGPERRGHSPPGHPGPRGEAQGRQEVPGVEESVACLSWSVRAGTGEAGRLRKLRTAELTSYSGLWD